MRGREALEFLEKAIFNAPKEKPGPKYRCTLCNDIIQSTHRHHMAYCKCGKSFVDGGSFYVRATSTVERVKEDSE